MIASSEELEDEPSANIAFVPLAMPSTAGPGTIAMIIILLGIVTGYLQPV